MNLYWRRISGYITELYVSLLVLGLLGGSLWYTDLIVIKWEKLTIMLAIVFVLWLVYYMFSFMIFSFKVVIDSIFKSYITVRGKFRGQFIYKGSSFLDSRERNKHGNMVTLTTKYFKVAVKTKTGIMIFTSSEFFDLEKDSTYEFVFCKRSRALVDVKTLDGEPVPSEMVNVIPTDL